MSVFCFRNWKNGHNLVFLFVFQNWKLSEWKGDGRSVTKRGIMGDKSKQHCTQNADAGKIYRIEAQNRCSVTKISPNSKKYSLLSMHWCLSFSARLKLKFKLWGTLFFFLSFLFSRPWGTWKKASIHNFHK